MLLDLLEDPDEIRRICIMGWKSTIKREIGDEECSILWDKQIAEGMDLIYICQYPLFEFEGIVTLKFLP